jgi:hypothetical protein
LEESLVCPSTCCAGGTFGSLAQREWTAAMTQFAIMFGDRFSVE